MTNEKELRLLCDTLKRCRVPASLVSPLDEINSVIDFSIRDIFLKDFRGKSTVQNYLGVLSPKTMYKHTDEFNLCYIYMKVSDKTDASVLFVGPYLSEPLSSRQLLELGEKLGVAPKSQRYFEKMYQNIPILSENDSAFIMLDTFCEHIWGSPSFEICNVNKIANAGVAPLFEMYPKDDINDTIFNTKTMEVTYKLENELMQAVTLGQIHKETLIPNSFSEEMFEKRVSDPLRNVKNYTIIMNTLLRKAAEQGGVHPFHIDKLSSEFAHKIEQLTFLSQSAPLMREMFRSYCRLVRTHSIQKYSLTIQNTILIIDKDLSADLSLSKLANKLNISPAYLATLFKKETRKTVSEYIREKRIRYAANLLVNTRLQVQTVALHCGIMDVQYFSKLFKKQMGKTPKEYRETARHGLAGRI